MTIFFDTPQLWPGRLCARLGPCAHLVTDGTPAELADFARGIGLKPAWLQHAGTWREHYHLFGGRIARAVAAGAKQIGRREFVMILRAKRGVGTACT